MDPLMSINLLICGIAKLKVIILFSSSLQNAIMDGYDNMFLGMSEVKCIMNGILGEPFKTNQSFQDKICDPSP
jgi:hypothetical protein